MTLLSNARIYLCGGAVRDNLLGKRVQDRDFVVVGSNDVEMLTAGFERVGMDFPVFLHPETREEYALARREKKVGAGYTGFTFEADRSVTLYEDLERRDLTVNSMAMDDDGTIVDPFGGQADLKAKVLRHTSAAFAEDPLRVVRLARFFARYEDFTVAGETMSLCSDMVDRGDLNELSEERFWRELVKVFGEAKPSRFFELLYEVGALNKVTFFQKLFRSVNGSRLKELMNLADACALKLDSVFAVDVFAALVAPWDTVNFLPTTRCGNLFVALQGYNELGGPPAAHEVVSFLSKCRAWGEGTIVFDLVDALNVLDRVGRKSVYFYADKLMECYHTARAVSAEPYLHLKGPAIGQAMAAERARRVAQVL